MSVCACLRMCALPPLALARFLLTHPLAWSVWESFSNVFSPLDRSHKSLEMFLAGYFIGASDRWPVGWLPPSSPSLPPALPAAVPPTLVGPPPSFLSRRLLCLLTFLAVRRRLFPAPLPLAEHGWMFWVGERTNALSESVVGCGRERRPKPKAKSKLSSVLPRVVKGCFMLSPPILLLPRWPRSHPGHEMHWPFFSLLQSPRIASRRRRRRGFRGVGRSIPEKRL